MSSRPSCHWPLMICAGCLIHGSAAIGQTTADATLDTIVIEQEGEPETDLPLGTGISGEALKAAPGSAGDPLRSLQSLPGLVYTDDESIAPAVRGSGPDDNTYQADFLPVGYLFHAGGAISVFNSELVESFSIYPSAYGPEFYGMTGGAFDVRLRDPEDDRLRATFDINILQAGILVEGPVTDDQSFYLAGRFSYLDLLVEDQLEQDAGIEFVQFPKYSDYQGKYVWRASNNSTVRLQATGATDELELLIDEDAEDIDTDPLLAGRHFESSQFDQQGIVWDQDLGGGSNLKSAIGHTAASTDAAFGGAGDVTSSTEAWRLKSHWFLPVNEKHELTFGAELASADIDFDLALNDPGCTQFEPECQLSNAERLTTTERAKVDAQHVFARDNWYLSEKLTLFPGVSVQHENYLDKTFVEPRFSLEYDLSDTLVFSAGLGMYHQMPGFTDLNEQFGNPKLDYIEAKHAVVGLEKQARNGWSVKSELYYKQLDQLVAGDEQTRYNNDGKGTAYGLDTLIRKDLSNTVSGWLSVSLSDSERENPRTGQRFDFAYDQPFNVSLVTQYKPSERWTLGAKLWAHSGSVYTPIVGATPDENTPGLFNPEFGKLNSKRLPAFTRLDLRADRQFAARGNRSISAYLELLNALGASNVAGYDYNRDYSERTEITQLERIIAIGIKAEF